MKWWRQPINPTEKLEALDSVIKALSHPARRQILMAIHMRREPVTAGQLAARFACAWPTTTRHLRVLEEAGLLNHERQGRTRLYVVNREVLALVSDWLDWFKDSRDDGNKARDH